MKIDEAEQAKTVYDAAIIRHCPIKIGSSYHFSAAEMKYNVSNEASIESKLIYRIIVTAISFLYFFVLFTIVHHL